MGEFARIKEKIDEALARNVELVRMRLYLSASVVDALRSEIEPNYVYIQQDKQTIYGVIYETFDDYVMKTIYGTDVVLVERSKSYFEPKKRLPDVGRWRDMEYAPRDGTAVLTWNGRKPHTAKWDPIDYAWVSLHRTSSGPIKLNPQPIYFQPIDPLPNVITTDEEAQHG